MRKMKVLLSTVVLAAVFTLARAQAQDECGATPAPESRAQMLSDVDAWRSLELPPGDPADVKFGPSLDRLKSRLNDPHEDVPSLRRALHDWKLAVFQAKYGDSSGPGFCAYVNGDTRKARSIADFARALTVQVQIEETTRARLASFAAAQSPFDGARAYGHASYDFSNSSAFFAPASAGPDDLARYSKVRQILVSEGANPRIVDAAIREALRQHADPLLVLSVINAESGFNPYARSAVGARGLMQIMPGTGRDLGVNNAGMLYDVETNIAAGVRYLRGLWGDFADFSMSNLQNVDPFYSRGVKNVVAAYNAGPGAVQKYHGVPPYLETQGYVRAVLDYYEQLRRYLLA